MSEAIDYAALISRLEAARAALLAAAVAATACAPQEVEEAPAPSAAEARIDVLGCFEFAEGSVSDFRQVPCADDGPAEPSELLRDHLEQSVSDAAAKSEK